MLRVILFLLASLLAVPLAAQTYPAGNTLPSGSIQPGNPTATIGTSPVIGTAPTYQRSDSAPAILQCSTTTFGACKVDGTTITASGGVISASGASVHYGATSQTITATQWLNHDVFVVSAASQTLTLPVVTTLAPNGSITIITVGAIVTLQPNAADGINAVATGSPVLIPANIDTEVTTSGSSGASALRVSLGRGGHFTLSWGGSQNLSTPGSAGIPIGRVANTTTIYTLHCNPSVVVGGSATFDVYAAPSATALGSGTKLNTTSCDANTGAGTDQNLGVASAAVATGDWIGIVATGAGWASSAGWGGLDVEFR